MNILYISLKHTSYYRNKKFNIYLTLVINRFNIYVSFLTKICAMLTKSESFAINLQYIFKIDIKKFRNKSKTSSTIFSLKSFKTKYFRISIVFILHSTFNLIVIVNELLS